MSRKSAGSRLTQFPAGTVLVHENERSRKMFIIRKGKVRVYKNYMGQRVTLAILGEGEIFGELSFFDAEPRSASVEALTTLSAVVIDGDRATEQIAQLPDWVVPIFKSVFHRFREADQKIIVLQSMNEYQKKSFKRDTVGNTIYLELLRFLKTLEILYSQGSQKGERVASEKLLSELDEVLGNRYIGLKVFWRLLKEYDFMDHHREETEGSVALKLESLGHLKNYLNQELTSERFLLLSHPAIALLRRIVGFTHADELAADASKKPVEITFEDIQLSSLPLFKDAVKELTSKNILKIDKEKLTVNPAEIYRLYTYQSILKSFDHTIVNLD